MFPGPRERVEAYPGATPEERKIAERKVKKRINESTQIPEELKAALCEHAGEFLTIKTETPKRGPRGHGPEFQIGQLGWKRFAIKDDYLKFVESVGAATLAMVTAIAVPVTAPVVTAATLLVGGAALADRLASKSASLTPEQYRLLLTLKARGPVNATTLGVYLSGLHIAGADFWTEERTTQGPARTREDASRRRNRRGAGSEHPRWALER